MFEHLKEQPKDKILALMQAFKDDPRDDKIDLGVGVYRNPEGVTPIMRAVKKAERRWWEAKNPPRPIPALQATRPSPMR